MSTRIPDSETQLSKMNLTTQVNNQVLDTTILQETKNEHLHIPRNTETHLTMLQPMDDWKKNVLLYNRL